ncbi:BTB/POZ and TAZ domain-containing protein 2-like [Impatiens glandulifera]|uniref:BTB/POZ and TAZ domain-containing protein 2-like n=1 Tax=Impatiens glandulifera TaxID=253017 RepID=UPI001FB098CE|nr:BTB/POZ and TAZ domain-containing protein 2-like [Impatiens glandulifera]
MTGHLYLLEDDSDQQLSSEFSAAAADIHIVTAGGIRIPAHRSILASASPVLENIIDRPNKKNHKSSERTIPILGVPSEAVAVFVRFLYSSKCTEEEMDLYGFHLLTLSHAFAVPQLKQRCAKALIQQLKISNVIDMLQLARLCDASELYFRSMKLVSTKIKLVEKTEGWKFVQKNDPWLELEILQFIDDIESRKKRTRRQKEERSLYLQLSEAMECLEHICTEGCTNIGPYDMEPGKKKKVPCQKFATCKGLELLFRHFATCKRRVNNGCDRCKRMWQLLRLHSSICDNPDLCKVPLCRQFKLKGQQKRKGEDEGRWKVLVRKVAVAKAMSFLSFHKRLRNGGLELKPSKKESCL